MSSFPTSINKFLKTIGAFTVPDEDIEIYGQIQSMPRAEREVLHLILNEGRTTEEVGRRLGLSTEEVVWTYAEALRVLAAEPDLDRPEVNGEVNGGQDVTRHDPSS